MRSAPNPRYTAEPLQDIAEFVMPKLKWSSRRRNNIRSKTRCQWPAGKLLCIFLGLFTVKQRSELGARVFKVVRLIENQ